MNNPAASGRGIKPTGGNKIIGYQQLRLIEEIVMGSQNKSNDLVMRGLVMEYQTLRAEIIERIKLRQ